MHIAILSNAGPRCGIAEHGLQLQQALTGLGHRAELFALDYPRYPSEIPNLASFDVVHINFHPATLGHIQPQHLPKGPLYSAFFHEVDPNWGAARPAPRLWDSVELKLSSEVVRDVPIWIMPVPDYKPKSSIAIVPRKIGHTGIRGEGLDRLEPLCKDLLYTLSKSTDWLNLEDEIERLASCHLVVCHLHSGYSGQSSSILTAIASRRPVLCNSSKMTEVIRLVDKDLANELYVIEDMKKGIETVLEDISLGLEKRPFKLAEELSFTKQASKLIVEWEKRL